MLGASDVHVFQLVAEFLGRLMNIITMEYLLYGAVGLLVLLWLISIIRTRHSYELRMVKSLTKINKYLQKNPYIKEDNLIEFNNKMKSVPQTLRYCWQEYMLNRDKLPSEYMNVSNCIDQPSKTSSYTGTVRSCKLFTIILAVVSFLLGIASVGIESPIPNSNIFSGSISSVIVNIFVSAIIPVLILTFGYLFVVFLNARQSALVADLYYTFHEFQRSIDKASASLPDFIDYELLFTKKEIKNGIPVLQEYLEKVALQEQKQKEEESLAPVQYEDYEFEKLGVDNSLLLDRAMKESEKYLTIRNNLNDRIKDVEKKQYTLKKAYDEQTKDYERRIQASNESIAQLNEQMQNTTSKIESNYIRKRINDEQQRLQQVLSDQDNANQRFQKDQGMMQDEIDKYKEDIEKRKTLAQDAMIAECKTYVNKVYEKVSRVALEKIEPYTQQLEKQQVELQQHITDLDNQALEKMEVMKAMEEKLADLEHEFNVKTAEIEAIKSVKEYFTSDEFFKRVALQKKELKNYVKSGKGERPLLAEKEYDGALATEDLDQVYANNTEVENTSLDQAESTVSTDYEKVIADLKTQNETLQKEKKELEAEKQKVSDQNAQLLEEKTQLVDEKEKVEKQNQEVLAQNEKLENANAILTKEQEKLKKTIDETLTTISQQEKEKVQDKRVQDLKNIKLSHIPYTGKYTVTTSSRKTKKSNTLKTSLNKLLQTVERLNDTKTVTKNAKVNKK